MTVAAKYKERVQDTSTTTGTGDFTLSGSAPTGGFQTFNAAFGTGVRFSYLIQDTANSAWESGVGVLSGATTLVREEVKESSNSGALVSFAAGTKDVFCHLPASFAVLLTPRGAGLARARGYDMP